jgi:hypothetical protein
MPVIIVGAEKNFAALRPRLFEGRVSTVAVEEVAEAVRIANPHANLDALEPGTVLTVPDLPKVSVRGDISLDDASRQTVAGVAEVATATLAGLTAAARSREKDAAAERKQVAKALAADELDTAARRDKALGANLKAVRESIAAEDDRAKERTAALDKARADWSAELKALTKLLP